MSKLLENMKAHGFLDDEIKYQGHTYKLRFLLNSEYQNYLNMIKNENNAVQGLKYIIKKSLYREEVRKKLFRKPEIIKIFDFDIEKYPKNLFENFTRDLFIIQTGQDFFRQLEEGEVDHIEK